MIKAKSKVKGEGCVFGMVDHVGLVLVVGEFEILSLIRFRISGELMDLIVLCDD